MEDRYPCCAVCIYSAVPAEFVDPLLNSKSDRVECRRNPVSLLKKGVDWCGEFSAKPAAAPAAPPPARPHQQHLEISPLGVGVLDI